MHDHGTMIHSTICMSQYDYVNSLPNMNSPLIAFGPRISQTPLRRLESGAATCGKESRGEISRWRWSFSRTSGTQMKS